MGSSFTSFLHSIIQYFVYSDETFSIYKIEIFDWVLFLIALLLIIVAVIRVIGKFCYYRYVEKPVYDNAKTKAEAKSKSEDFKFSEWEIVR